MNSAKYGNEQSAAIATKMTHSTSVYALTTIGASSGMGQVDHYRAANGINLHNRQFAPDSQGHGSHVNHSQSTANLSAPQKLSFSGASNSANGRQSATNGIKLTPSQQLGTRAGIQRTESPIGNTTSAAGGSGQTLILGHQHHHNLSQNAHHQVKSRQVSSKIGGGNSGTISGRHSSVVLVNSSSGQASSGNARQKTQSGSFSGV